MMTLEMSAGWPGSFTAKSSKGKLVGPSACVGDEWPKMVKFDPKGSACLWV